MAPVLITGYLGCLVGLSLRHRHNIEAAHILELNILLDMTISLILNGLQNFDSFFFEIIEGDSFCILIHAVTHWAKFSFFADFSLGEIDKFLSIHWSTSYKLMVTKHRALVLIIAVKILLIPITVTAALLDTDYLRCLREYLFLCGNFKSTNFFWTTIPMVICSTVTITVSIYTFRVARRLANTVTPVVNIRMIPSVSASVHSHEVACQIVPTLSTLTSDLLQTTKTAVKFNIISLVTLGLMLPPNIVNTWVFFSGINCTNSLDFPSRVKPVMLLHFIFVIIIHISLIEN